MSQVRKYIKLPSADCFNHPNSGYTKSKSVRRELDAMRGTESYRRLRVKLLKLQAFKCAYCRTDLSGKRANIEHIVPVGFGGTNKLSNLVMACPNCNKEKGIKFYKKREKQQVKRNIREGLPNELPRHRHKVRGGRVPMRRWTKAP